MQDVRLRNYVAKRTYFWMMTFSSAVRKAVQVPRDAKRQPNGWVRQLGKTELFEWVGVP